MVLIKSWLANPDARLVITKKSTMNRVKSPHGYARLTSSSANPRPVLLRTSLRSRFPTAVPTAAPGRASVLAAAQGFETTGFEARHCQCLGDGGWCGVSTHGLPNIPILLPSHLKWVLTHHSYLMMVIIQNMISY